MVLGKGRKRKVGTLKIIGVVRVSPGAGKRSKKEDRDFQGYLSR